MLKKVNIPFTLLVFVVTLAGSASLLYEVVWIRQLGLSFGSTAVATSVMLSAFLGGLALGSFLIGRRADTLKSPFKTLGSIEIVAAIFGLASIPALAYVGRAYVLISNTFGLSGGGSLALRALFAGLVMLLPAILFGMTFPVATVCGSRLIGGEKAAGTISAVSAFGSAIGAALTGLLLEPALGIFATALVGMGINLVAAALAFAGAKLGANQTELHS